MAKDRAPPRYSILLPTRNGASLLEGCIDAVLDQPYADFELVISDNASEDETPEILARYASDPRVRLLRQDELIDVTANWNAALAASIGERITLIGDDDLLLPGYFQQLDELLARYQHPDVLMYDGYSFICPGIDEISVSRFGSAFRAVDPPVWGELSAPTRNALARRQFDFDFILPLSMQLMSASRGVLAAFPDRRLYRHPFPDNYASLGLLLTAPRWVIAPERLAVVGISPKSFGTSALRRGGADRGPSYLRVDPRFEGMLPGSLFFNGHWEVLLAVREDFSREVAGAEINRSAYILFQAYFWYYECRLGSMSVWELARRMRLLGFGDWLGLPRELLRRLDIGKLRRLLGTRSGSAYMSLAPDMTSLEGVSSIVEFADWVQTAEV